MTICSRELLDGDVAADQDGYPGILGYEGPALSEVTGARGADARTVHRGACASRARRGRADPPERALVRARPPAAPAVLGRRARPRPRRASAPATRRRSRCSRRSARSTPASSARRTAPPPATAARSAAAPPGPTRSRTTSRFQPGDMLVSETAAPFWGYNAELERGMVVGEPTDEQRALHGTRSRRSRSPSTPSGPARPAPT